MKKYLVLLILTSLSFLILYPIIFIVLGSFMGNAQVQKYLIPILLQSDEFVSGQFLSLSITLRFYIELLIDTPEFYVMFWNSVKIAVSVTIGQLLTGIPAAWAFAQYKFKFRKLLFYLYIILLVMPFIVMMLPQYYIMKNFGFLDTLWSIILPGIFSTMPVIIAYPYFKKIPMILLETARLDGCKETQILLYIGIPIAKPAIITSSLLSFVEYWSILEQPLVFIKDMSKWNLSLFLSSIKLDNASIAFVSSVISLIPPILFFLLSREFLEQGIAGAEFKE